MHGQMGPRLHREMCSMGHGLGAEFTFIVLVRRDTHLSLAENRDSGCKDRCFRTVSTDETLTRWRTQLCTHLRKPSLS